MQIPQKLNFSTDFLFGSAVSAFQVEGDSGERKSDWDNFLHDHPKIVLPGQKGPQWWVKGKAEDDIAHMEKLGLSVQRLSIEWARIEPVQGSINEKAIERYKQILASIKNARMLPMVTLNHYVLPDWMAKKGSWGTDEIIPHFERFVELVLRNFPDVPYWITLNEPNYLLDCGYLSHTYPPQKGNLLSAYKVRSRMIVAHKKAYALIKHSNQRAQVGVAFALRWYPPENPTDPLEVLYAKAINWIDGFNFVGAFMPADFIGCNFYTGYFLDFDPRKTTIKKKADKFGIEQTKLFGQMKKPGAYVSDADWPIVPDFLLQLLRSLHHSFHLPIIITENGIADEKDTFRAFYILTHLVAVWRAREEGIKAVQYIHWATNDNLEWLAGYRLHFGLLHVDPVTGIRRMQKSSELYKEIVTTKTIEVEKMIQKYIPQTQQDTARKIVTSLVQGESHSVVSEFYG